jgi:hypothetical protein
MLSLSPNDKESRGKYLYLQILSVVWMDEEERHSHESGSGRSFENGDRWRFMGMGMGVGMGMGMGLGMGVSVTKPVVCVFLPRLTGEVFPFHFPPVHERFVT